MKNDFLIVHRKMVPDYLEKVIYARKILENKEVTTVTDAVQIAGISRNTYYKYKDYVFETTENKATRHAVLSLILKDENGSLATVIQTLTGLSTSILTISQAIPINGKANVLVSLDITSLNGTVEDMVKALRQLHAVKSVHLDAME